MRKRFIMGLAATVIAACTAFFFCACDNNTETHTHEYIKIVIPATCSERGFNLYVCACGDTYKDDYVNMLSHTQGEWITDTEATCTASGSRHKECMVCHTVIEQETIPTLDHKFSKKDTDEKYLFSPATCTKKAEYYYSCKCGEKGTETFEYGETLPHIFTVKKAEDKYLKSSATCTQKAVYYYSCECGEKGTETFEYGDYAAHKEVTDEAVAPTKTEDGLTEGKHCSVCKRVLVEQKVIPATGSVGLVFSLNSDGRTYSVTGFGSCTDKEVIIPKKYSDGNAVTEIGEKAFENCSSVTSITIPDTIKSIGNRAFYGCSGLTEIHIPSSVTEIGTQIFYKASNLNTVYYDSTYASEKNPFLNTPSINKVVIGAYYVARYLLYNCVNVEEVILKSGVTSIGYAAFLECKALKKVNYTGTIDQWVEIVFMSSPLEYAKNLYINDELVSEITLTTATKISGYAFSGCTSLTSINIPDSVTSIGGRAFNGCSSLTSISIPNSVTSIGDYAFWGCSGLTSINIPDSVTSIGGRAFNGCSSLTSISIPDSVTSIGSSAFSGCTSLVSINIPNSVTSIGNSAFEDCSSLTSINIPNSVTSIGGYAFWNCKSLTSINMPGSVTSIGESAFVFCYKLTEIHYGGTIEEWNRVEKSTSYSGTGSYTIYCTDGNIKK